ncbi:MAG: acetyl-CoA hydrolase/transferase family protein [Desulfobacteraceae bacterium]|nr:MAG: acetyl-CoA hydrolase/transferase family protein [Desulfobacteraceae bacterium]
MPKNKDWRDIYKRKIISGEEAARKIKSGMSVDILGSGNDPDNIMIPLTNRKDIDDVQLHFSFMRPDSVFASPENFVGRFKLYSHFLTDVTRPLVQKGLMDYIPSHNSATNRYFFDGSLKLDAAFLSLSAPDQHGFLSMSYRPAMHKPMVQKLKKERKDKFLIIACVNENLPFCCGDTLVHESEIDFMVEDPRPMKPAPWYTKEQLDEEIPVIAENVATLIEDGATLEFGVGKVPSHVCPALHGKNDLGIHTEVFTQPVLDLIKSGVVTGKYKELLPYQVVFASAVPSTMEMYEWFDRNPVCAPYPLYYVCNAAIVSQNHKFTAINSAIQVDLTGQVNSEVVFNSQWSGTGGHTDYSRAACLSKGGKAIIALQSTSKKGTISRIVGDSFYPGGVSTTRNDVQFVVTEYGIAALEGKSLRERAHAVIEIAHPKFRDQLIEQAKERGLW